jgi:glycosyltransferase involved in cell wall biosynthesis
MRFITSTPLDVFQGSGTFVGIAGLAKSLRALGVEIELITPGFHIVVYTAQRIIFNESLRLRAWKNCDVTVGFDMDGYALAGKGVAAHVAAIKGVISDELRFESGITKATMRLQAAFERRNILHADLVITTSHYASKRITDLYGVSRAPSIIPELIDLAAWNELFFRNPAAPNPTKFVVLSVCRFYPRKRLNVLIGAAQRLRPRIPELELRIVGGGPEAHLLKDLCKRKGLESVVIWRENITQAELAREYNGCHIFCLPSVQEGFGVVFLEAMANGKPIVAARAGAAPEVVQHGLLVEPDDEQDLANAIEKLYSHPELRQTLGAAGSKFVKQFDASIVGQRFLDEITLFKKSQI